MLNLPRLEIFQIKAGNGTLLIFCNEAQEQYQAVAITLIVCGLMPRTFGR